jgi:uncharacterized protein YaeQ
MLVIMAAFYEIRGRAPEAPGPSSSALPHAPATSAMADAYTMHRQSPPTGRMALKSTIYKAELQVSDMDRHYYATHALTLAQHPSETEERLMVRLLAFALHADDALEFGRGLSSDDEPDLWRKSLSGEIELWIDLGQPDEARIRKACGRAREVVVVNYGGRGSDIWWDKHGGALSRIGNLTVLDIGSATVAALGALANRTIRLQCMVQDGQFELYGEGTSLTVESSVRMAPAGRAH